MRTKRKHDRADCPDYADHPHGEELREIDRLLEEIPQLVALVHGDLVEAEGVDPDHGRKGMTARQVLGAAISYHIFGCSFETLAFLLKDSASYQCLCRIPDADQAPSSSTLHENISKIRPETWKIIQQILVLEAAEREIEDGRQMRADCTVCDADIHPPTDVSLCRDVVRIGSRLLGQAADLEGEVAYTDHTLRATRRALEFRTASGETRRKRCRDLLAVTRRTLGYAESALDVLDDSPTAPIERDERPRQRLIMKLSKLIERGRAIIEQTWRRLLKGEKVSASEKLVSVVEPHADIIVTKDGEVQFGHKIVLTTGTSSMVLDVQVLEGNPADSTWTKQLIDRHIARFGSPPERVAFDGGFASRDNLASLREDFGVEEVAFHKRRGLTEAEMASSHAVYRQLRRFRAGIEGNISWLKDSLALRRCRWRSGIEGFKAYVYGAVVSANLLKMARHRLDRRPG
jgi:IS5 family transposase